MMSTAIPPQGQKQISGMRILFECGRFKEFECEQQIVGGARAQSGRAVGGGLLNGVGIVDGMDEMNGMGWMRRWHRGKNY